MPHIGANGPCIMSTKQEKERVEPIEHGFADLKSKAVILDWKPSVAIVSTVPKHSTHPVFW